MLFIRLIFHSFFPFTVTSSSHTLDLDILDISDKDLEVGLSSVVENDTPKIENKNEETKEVKNNKTTNKMKEKQFPKCINNQIHYPSGYVGGICYENAAVSTEVSVCSEIGVQILKLGGNAADAAVASCICVGIINSFSSGIGGGGFALIRIPMADGTDLVEMIDFRETAPSRIKIEDYGKKKDLTKKGGLAIGVPGEIAGLYKLHSKYGKLEWKELFIPNIKIARNFEVTEQLYKRLLKLKDCILKDPGLKEIYSDNGLIYQPGDKISRNNYADTLEKISNSPEDFYKGDIAKSIVKSVQSVGGVITTDDLFNYKAKERKVLEGKFLDYKIYSTDLPTSGCLLIQALNILEEFDLCEIKEKGENLEKKLFPHFHILIETYKFMSAKRGKLADIDSFGQRKRRRMENLVKKLISKEYATEIVNKININTVLSDDAYGFEGNPHDDHGTTHLNVIDKDDMAVLITSTVNLEFGAKVMCKETGIIFNNEMDDFYVPGVKNAFDLAGMRPNIVRPNARPFSSAAPFLLIKNSEMIALGAAGGTRIPTSLVGIIFHMMLGKNLSEAVKELRLHNQFYPKKTYVEGGFPIEIKNYLTKLGHDIQESELNTIFTSVQGIRVIKDESGAKTIEAVADERKGGVAYGY